MNIGKKIAFGLLVTVAACTAQVDPSPDPARGSTLGRVDKGNAPAETQEFEEETEGGGGCRVRLDYCVDPRYSDGCGTCTTNGECSLERAATACGSLADSSCGNWGCVFMY